MRITNFTDYGLRTLIYLACLPKGQLSSITEVSTAYSASQNHMTKVIGQLRKCGYIEALRGKGGGIRLAIPPEKIFIGQVIKELEFKSDGVDCVSTSCVLQPHCILKGALFDAMDNFFIYMNQYTLSDLVQNKKEICQVIKINFIEE